MEQDKHQATLNHILQFVELPGQEILEIGCGPGRVTALLAGRPKRLVAIDPDPACVAEARSKVAGVDFRIGSGQSLVFPDESFDVVLFTLSLHHQNSRQALKEAHRVLRKNGRALVLEPVAQGDIDRICRLFNNEEAALSQALAAIDASPFIVNKRRPFDVDWEFENKQDLYAWLFDYYDRPFDPSLAARVDEALGVTASRQPMILKEANVILSLQKPADDHRKEQR